MRTKLFVAFAIIALLGAGLFVWLAIDTAPEHVPEISEEMPAREVIGHSVEGRTIEAYTYGAGESVLAFVGGIHGGYEWNSVVLAYTLMDYLAGNPEAIPTNLRIVVIPSANPDGLFDVVGKEGRFALADVRSDVPLGTGRFNANGVDLNRNFACNWQPEGTWRSETVSAGTAAFSEPEARAIRDFALEHKPLAIVFWHSQANAVYASECKGGILPETLAITHAYAGAAGYRAVESFDAYEVSGDVEGWLASIGIPSITVELATHETVEWQQNLAGVRALFAHFGGAVGM